VTLHENEIQVDEAAVRALLREQRPEWAGLSLAPAGAGTDNRMYRLGGELLVRMPRTPGNAEAVHKEQEWLPRLAPHLSCRVPEPVHSGAPGAGFPLAWSVYRWIDGEVAGPGAVRDWAAFGGDLAAVVRELHAAPLMGAVREGELSWYRGGGLRECDGWVSEALDACEALEGHGLDVRRLRQLWREALELPEPSGPQVWLHGDLKPTNLLVRDGRLHAVIDFGCLSVGHPDAEHAPVWDLPAAARRAYREALRLDEATWQRARAWAVAVGVSGVPYYWSSYPEFVAECLARLRAVLGEAGESGAA
jgi:aminoglycoside phosphotransferase (APT) family kinase protein